VGFGAIILEFRNNWNIASPDNQWPERFT